MKTGIIFFLNEKKNLKKVDLMIYKPLVVKFIYLNYENQKVLIIIIGLSKP